MTVPVEQRPTCPVCASLMLMDLDPNANSESESHHWHCRRAYDAHAPCTGTRTSDGGVRYSAAFQAEDLAIHLARGTPLIVERIRSSVARIDRALAELDGHPALSCYLSNTEHDDLSLAHFKLDNLSLLYRRARAGQVEHDHAWLDLSERSRMDHAESKRIALAFLRGRARVESVNRARCLADFIARQSELSSPLRDLVVLYESHPHNDRWQSLVEGVAHVLCTEGFNVRKPQFERYIKQWFEGLRLRRSLRDLTTLAAMPPAAYERLLEGQRLGRSIGLPPLS